MAETCAFTVASDTFNSKAICLLSSPLLNIISTGTCCGVSVASFAAILLGSESSSRSRSDIVRHPHITIEDFFQRRADLIDIR